MAKIKVRKVIDGDTFQDTRSKFYRLENVDTPEKRKRGYRKAKETLQIMIEGEKLIVKKVGKSYNRIVVSARKPRQKTTITEKMRRKGYK